MSFQELVEGGSRELRPYNRAQDQATSDLISSVFKLQTEVSRLKADVQRLGTPRDTPELRQKIADTNDRLKLSARDIGERLKAAATANNSPQTQKIVSNFQAVLANFESIMKTAHAKEAASLPRKPAHVAVDIDTGAAGEDGEQRQALLQQQQQQQQRQQQEMVHLETELQYNEVLIEERDEAIQEISHQIGEVHEIFQDLATLVNDQGGMVDDISDHIERAADRTRDASTQLRKAEKSQRGARNRQCWLFAIAGVVLLVLFLVLVS